MSEPLEPKVVYVVQQINWRFNDMWYYRDDDGGPVGWPTHAFTTRDKAERHRRDKEREARAGENPFGYGEKLSELSTTHRDDASLAALVRELGLAAPRGVDERGYFSLQNWEDWWDWQKKGMTAQQAERIWEAMDRVTFFEIVQLQLGGDRP